LSEQARASFLTWFDADPQQAEAKYRLLRSKLVFFFQQNGCADPHNLADEVFIRVLRRLSEGVEPWSGIAAYCYGVAEFVLREERRRPSGEELPDELPLKQRASSRELLDSERALMVRQCLNRLPQADRDLFRRYHLGDREELARELNKTPNNLRVMVCRIRQRLQDAMQSEPAE